MICLITQSQSRNPKYAIHQLQDEENVLDYEEEVEHDCEDIITSGKVAEEKKIWKKGGWRIDPRLAQTYRPRLCNALQSNELGIFFQFLPVRYIKEEMIPAMVDINVIFEELLITFPILKSMEVQRLPERRMYLVAVNQEMFKGLNYGLWTVSNPSAV